MKKGLRDLISVCLLAMLCLGLTGKPVNGNASEKNFSSADDKTSSPLFFSQSGNYYYIGNRNWNFTYIDDATNGWVWKVVQVKINGSWEPIYGSFWGGSSQQLTKIYKSSMAYDLDFSSASAVQNTTSEKRLSLTGSVVVGTVNYTLTMSTYVNETDAIYIYNLSLNDTVTFSLNDGIWFHEFSTSSSSRWYVKSHNTTIWFPKGFIWRSNPNDMFYAQIVNGTALLSHHTRSDHETGRYAVRVGLPGVFQDKTSVTSYMFLLFQNGGTLSQFAETITDKLDSLAVDSVYEYEDVDASIRRHIDKEVFHTENWQIHPNDPSSIGIYIGTMYGLGGTWQDSAGVGDALLYLYELTGNTTYLERAREIGNLIVNHAVNSTYKYFYENIDTSDNPIQNPLTSQDDLYVYGQKTLIEFLIHLTQVTNNQTYQVYALDCLDFWLTKQDSCGYWDFRYIRNTLQPRSATFYTRSGFSAFAEVLVNAYDVSNNSTYLDRAELAMNWLYVNRLQYGDGTEGLFASLYAGYEESQFGLWHAILALSKLYQKTSNSTYLTWAENLYNLTKLYLLRKNGGGEGHEAWMLQWSQDIGHFDYATIRYYAIEALAGLFNSTGKIGYIQRAILFQRACREFMPLYTHYYHIQENGGYFENVQDKRVSAHIIRSAIILKRTIGDVYLGSQQVSLNEDTAVSGDANGIYAYTTTIRANITSATYESNKLTLTIYAPSGTTSTTKVYVGDKGEPASVLGANSSDYDSTTKIVELNVTHAGEREVILNWRLPPVAVFTVSNSTPYTGETVMFNATPSYDSDGYITSFTWDFGDGNVSTGNITAHAYTDNGTYTVALTVTDNDGLNDTAPDTMTVQNRPPVAQFTESAEIVDTGVVIYFNASDSYDLDGYIVSYFWDFGDDTNTTGVIVNHTYVDDGVYTATLTVTDNDGATTSTNATKTILNRPPVAIFIESTETVYTGETITFNATDSYDSDGYIANYLWDFGDRTNATDVIVEHAYVDDGIYTVTLTVTDDDGATATSTSTKTVLNQPPIAVFTESAVTVYTGEPITFNASDSFDPDGSIASYTWDFGDGNLTAITNPIIVHAYSTAGTYNVNLTVTDNDGATTQKAIQVFVSKTTSTLMLTLSTTTITLGENVTLSGQISPTRARATVTIMYRLLNESDWNVLTTVTDANGQYSYSWRPEEAGTYEVKTSWEGDYNALPDESDLETLTVEMPSTNIPLYQIIGIIIAVVALGLIYMLVLRKLKST